MVERSIQSNVGGVRFSVVRAAAWQPGAGPEPALEQMPAMLRRRAGRVERMACEVAYRALKDDTDVPMVFCSRYGETTRSVELLEVLAAGETISPTSFSLSVHNSAAGLFSIAKRNTANALAIAAGEESAALGVIEACGLLADGAARVIVVYADCTLPPVYERYADTEPAAFAWACLLESNRVDRFGLDWESIAPDESAGRRSPAALEVLGFFQGDGPELIQVLGGRRWCWSRRG